eukprot:359746-Chlamydomonas_euryale.AAC.1
MDGWMDHRASGGAAQGLTDLQHNACGAVCVIGCQELVRVEDCHLGAPAPGLDAERAVRQSHDNLQ